MIKINKATVNDVIVTLTEKVTITNPIFLFEFENQNTKQKYYCIAADISAYVDR